MSTNESLQKILVPTSPSSITSTYHHDVYPRICVQGDLAGAAKGKRVLITGGGRGVGRQVAITWALAGATKVVITGRNAIALENVKKEISAKVEPDVEVIAIAGDVTEATFIEKLFMAAGDLDVLINNAGTMETRKKIHEFEAQEWWSVIESNLKGTFLPTREFLRRNLGRPLSILNTSSTLSANTHPGYSAYYPSKSLINRFTEFLHFEYQNDNVRVYAYHPGAIATDLIEAIPEGARHRFRDTTELAAGFGLWLLTQYDQSDFLRGKFVSANWDVDELITQKDSIEKEGLLWTRVRGFESGVKLAPGAW